MGVLGDWERGRGEGGFVERHKHRAGNLAF